MLTRTAVATQAHTRRTRLLYGLGTVAFGVKDQGFNALLMLYYNQVIGLPATWVGAAIMIAMVADALGGRHAFTFAR